MNDRSINRLNTFLTIRERELIPLHSAFFKFQIFFTVCQGGLQSSNIYINSEKKIYKQKSFIRGCLQDF